MKLNCNHAVKKLNGDPLVKDGKELTIGTVLSTILTTEPTEHLKPLKAYALAQRLYSQASTDLDEGDIAALVSIVESNKTWVPLVIAQVIQVLSAARKDK